MENRGKGTAGYELISLLPGFWEVSKWEWGLGACKQLPLHSLLPTRQARDG